MRLRLLDLGRTSNEAALSLLQKVSVGLPAQHNVRQSKMPDLMRSTVRCEISAEQPKLGQFLHAETDLRAGIRGRKLSAETTCKSESQFQVIAQ